MTAGTQYAIVLVTRPNTVRWGFMNSYSYAGGNLWLCCDATGRWMPTRTSDFGFKTYLGTAAPPVNRPPAVAADSAAVTFNEGAAQSNTGTYSDPDGDSVTLTASAGSLARTGTSTGTWSWNQAAADEGPTQTVTVTAADGQGHSVSTSFSVSVVAVAPTARIVTDPPTIPEGTSEPFTGSATSPSATDTTAGFTYAWTVTKNGSRVPDDTMDRGSLLFVLAGGGRRDMPSFKDSGEATYQGEVFAGRWVGLELDTVR